MVEKRYVITIEQLQELVSIAHANRFDKAREIFSAVFDQPLAAVLGSKGGKSTSEAKVRAARENAKKGGRPRKEVQS